MAEDPALSLRVCEIKNPTVLFERYSTEEIRRIERRVRGDIEQKKEELRQMVGERYRDLIDAADTIGEMRRCSESVVRSIQDMQRYCHALKQAKAAEGGPRQEVKVLTQQNHLDRVSRVCDVCPVAGAEAGELLHHGRPDQAPAGDPRADLERHGVQSVPAGHPALPALLPPARPAAAGGCRRGTLQPRSGPLPHPGPAGCHHGTLQVLTGGRGLEPRSELTALSFQVEHPAGQQVCAAGPGGVGPRHR